MKTLIFLVAGLATFASFAATTNAAPGKVPVEGAYIFQPGTQKGVIGIVNAQTRVKPDDFRALVDNFAKRRYYNVQFSEGEPVTPETATDAMAKAGYNVAVFLVDNEKSPLTVLVAPEQNWAILNVAAVTKDAASPAFAAARTRKELLRAFLCAAGAMSSEFGGGLMAPIKSPAELDKILEDPPFDVQNRVAATLKSVGVTPKRRVIYVVACKEGWAPEPQTEWQKLMWQRVHDAKERGPANALKIVPPKK